MSRSLFAHQVMALQWMQQHSQEPGLGLFMEMRLGKTLTVIRYAQHKLGDTSRIMVICPLSVIDVWTEELWNEGEEWLVLHPRWPDRSLPPARHWLITNYEQVRCRPEILTNVTPELLILDESTKIKNPKSQISKILCLPTNTNTQRIILSGHPTPEGPLDLFQQAKFLQGSLLNCRNYWKFRDTWFENRYLYEWVPKTGTVEVMKQATAHYCFYMSRKRAGLYTPKVHQKRYVEPNYAQELAYRQVKHDFEWNGTVTKYILEKYIWLARIAGGFSPDGELLSSTKLDELMELLTGELKTNNVLVWFRFNQEIQAAKDLLQNSGVSCHVVTGLTPPRSRALCFQFHRRVVLCQLKVGLYGQDISKADAAIYYSNGYSSEERIQSEDRTVHPQKKEPTLIMDLITRGTIDEEIVELLRNKELSGKRILHVALNRHFAPYGTGMEIHGSELAHSRSRSKRHGVGAMEQRGGTAR